MASETASRPVSGPVLAARCGAIRDVSAKLRERARAVREASVLLRRLIQTKSRATEDAADSFATLRLRRTGHVVHCVLCGERVPARDFSLAVGRPTHAICHN